MKKSFFYVAALMLGLAFTATSCSNDDDNEVSAADIDYNSENATSWHNYMKNVGRLLQTDATNLQAAWTTGGYGDAFINHNGEFTTAKTCVQQIIEGCIDIAGEVGSQKIGDPVSKYKAGNIQEAIYAVESWYSWNSLDDYENNIISIQNAYLGKRNNDYSTDATANSFSSVVKSLNPKLDELLRAQIITTRRAIRNIPYPFSSNLDQKAAITKAQKECASLVDGLELAGRKIASAAE